METYSFSYGLIRSIFIDPIGYSNSLIDYNYLLDYDEIRIVLPEKNRIIGLVNNSIPIIENLKSKQIYVYIYTSNKELIMIANNTQQLIETSKLIQQFWIESIGDQNLTIPQSQIDAANKIIDELKANLTGCSIDFWQWQGFPGLNNFIKL
jgi:hypothetical protein